MIIRTLGFYQPYATLMFHGKLETRWVKKGKKAPFPLGTYLIYSTQKAYSKEEFEYLSGPFANDAERKIKFDETYRLNGYALGFMDLVEVRDMGLFDSATAFVEYKQDPEYRLVALFFTNQKRLETPVPFKGKQGVGFLKDQHLITQYSLLNTALA